MTGTNATITVEPPSPTTLLLSASTATSSQAKPGLVQNISKPSSPMISHHVNSPTPTQYVTTLLTKPGVTAASLYHKQRRLLPALEPLLLQSSIAFTV